MNKTYRVVWNESTNTWVAVAEIATARGKSGKAKVVAASVAVVGALASPAHADLIWGSGSKAPGEGSMAMGINSDAKTRYTIAVGQDAVNKSNGDSAVLIGHDAQASSDANPNTGTNTMGQQVVIGESSRANSQSVAVGAQVYATGQASIAIGGDDLGNNDSRTSAGKYTGANAWRNYAGQPITVEGVSTKDASNPAIGFTSTTASGRGSIAIGHMSQSTGKASLAFGADSHAEADGAIAAGMASQAKGSAAVAIGVGAEAPEAHATAIGLKAKANGGNAFAAGSNAKADGKNSISLGSEASTETNSATYYRIKNVPDKTENNIAIGTKARSGGLQTIAFGAESVASKSQSVAFGFDAQATGDQSVALGANTRSMGDSSVAIGGDDLDSVASTVYRTTSASADNDAYNDTPLAQQYRALTGQNLVNFTPGNRYIGTSTGQAGVAVGVSAKAADLATAIGTKSHATGDYSVAFGVGANATLANAVALGAGSTTAANATDVPSATIGSITYGSATSPFAGSGKVVPGDQVSVGSAGFERQIKHVAPGAITAASTDAINGSQLFYVAKGLQDQISNNSATRSFGVNADNNSLKTHQLGKELAIVAGNTTEATSTSNLKTNVTQDAATGKTTVTVSMKDAPTFASVTTQDAAGNKTVTNAGGVTITPVSGNPVSLTKDGLNNGGNKITGVADGTIGAGSKEAVNGGQLHDLKENGFKIAADNGTADTVKLTETVKYTGDSNIVTTVKDNEIGFKLADSITVGPATGGNPVKIDGNAGTVTGLTNKTWNPNNITSGRGATEDQLKAAVATTPLTVANDGKVTPPAAADAGKLATAGDIANAINNSGFQATAGGRLASGTTATATTVKPGQKVTFAAGNGLTVKQDVDATNGDQTYTYALDAQTVVQNAQTPVVYTKADGTKVYKHTDGNFYDAPNGAGNQVAAGDVIASMQDASGNTTKPTTLANVKGNLADTATAATNPTNNDRTTLTANGKGNNAATVNDVLNAGFTVQGNGVNKDFVTHGDTINFVNGQGTVAKVNTTNGVTEVKFDTPMTYADAAGNPTNTPSNKVNLVGGTAGSPVTLGNVADGNIAAGSKEAINGGQLHDLKENGFKIAADNGTADTVKLTETVKYTGDSNIVTTVKDNEIGFKLADSITVGPATGGNPVKIDGNAGTVTGLTNKTWNPNNITSGRGATEDQLKAAQAAATSKVAAGNGISVTPNVDATTGSTTYTVAADTTTLNVGDGTGGNPAGKVITPTGADANKLATAGDIANAINNSGFKATAGGNLKGGTTATQELIKAGDTLTLKAGSGLTVEQTGSSFTYALNAQQVVQDAQTPVVYTKADGSKVYKHTDGNFYDQPNGAGTQVAAGDVIASMQGADGSTTATPATKDADGIMTMAGGTTLNNVASAGDITNPANAYRAVNAGDLNNSVQKLVNNGFKIDADNGTADTVKLGETVKYAGDGNITTTVSNNQIGFKLANTVTIGDAATGGKPVKIDGTAGTVTGLTNITWDPATTPITSGRAATEDQLKAVADAANSAGAGFTIAGNSKAAGVTTADETIKAGETLSIKGTGTGTFADYDSSNIQTQVGANGEVTVGLKKDLNVNSITAGNTKVDNGGITITNPTDPSKNVSLTGNGLNNGGNTITNVGDGVNDTDAVNVRQLRAAQTNVNNLTNNVIGTDKPNITTYDVHGNVADNQNTVVEAINNMNTGGIKFFHVNDGTGSQNTAGTLSHPEDSSAKGNYGAAVGYQAKADGESSVAFGKGAQATGKNTIAIGTGNVVTGEGSGAIGDPTTITGRGTYSVGNNNGTISANEAGVFGNNNTLTGDSSRIIGNSSTVTTTDTFVMGNNSTSNVANSVVLGSNAAATSAATASSAGTTTYASSVINGTTYNYAGATPTGVVSVGNVGAERRVQNVAAGLISADSTDAINGSQLYATNSAINALQTGAAGIVQYSNGNAQPNGGTPTNHVTMVGADQNAPVTVHNVAAGVAPTDAVNVSQLQGVAGQIGKVADEADAGTAAAMAAAGLPQAYLPGKSMVAVSGSTYRGKQGYAVGFSAINDGGNWIVKGIATGNSKGKFGATIGAGYQW